MPANKMDQTKTEYMGTPHCAFVQVEDVRQLDGDGEGHSIVIAANEKSRNRDELNLAGVRFDNYRKNPVVLWAHDDGAGFFAVGPSGGLPIGKTTKIGLNEKEQIEARFVFNSEDEFAARVENAWNGGFVRAASIRWQPLRISEIFDADGSFSHFRTEEADLLEWSVVSIPADPDTVAQSARSVGLPAEIFSILKPGLTEEHGIQITTAAGTGTDPDGDDDDETDDIADLFERLGVVEGFLENPAASVRLMEFIDARIAQALAPSLTPEPEPPDPAYEEFKSSLSGLAAIVKEKSNA